LSRAGLVLVFLVTLCLTGAATGRAEDNPTPTATPTAAPTLTPTATATPVPTPTSTTLPTPTATPRPAIVTTPEPAATAVREKRRHKRKRRPAVASPTPSVTATPETATRRHKHRRKARPRPTATPTVTPTPSPTPTPTQPLTLTTEDSIKPVTCNGPAKPPAAHPFLSPPYGGWTSIVSYFDHDSPNFLRDGLVVTTTGLQAQPDGVHQAADFPAYWSNRLRQYVYYDGHNGYDFDISYQPVYAAAPGKVIFARYEYPTMPASGYGKMVMIAHSGGYVTLYGHFSKIMVKAGQHVGRLQEIGISGNTGHSTGPHLHFTVFHNCTPTDPYGWSGPGPDPLVGYEGETSIYLWLAQPLVTNPPPAFPNLDGLPGAPVARMLLLRLPTAKDGTSAFVRRLRQEADETRKALGRHVRGVRIDLLRGALDITAPVSPARLYALPFVASIAASDAGDDARADVVRALARAALADPHRATPLARSPSWTGSVFQWEGRTFLVGRGPKAKRVDLRFRAGSGSLTVRKVQADPLTGAYAVDLGRMSRQQIAALRRQLRGERKRGPLAIQPVHHRVADRKPAPRTEGAAAPWGWIATALLLLAAVSAMVLRRLQVVRLIRGRPG